MINVVTDLAVLINMAPFSVVQFTVFKARLFSFLVQFIRADLARANNFSGSGQEMEWRAWTCCNVFEFSSATLTFNEFS